METYLLFRSYVSQLEFLSVVISTENSNGEYRTNDMLSFRKEMVRT
jgi:hypothetical protein